MAFWVNAYNAFCAADRGQQLSNPRPQRDELENSIRQIPGAFEGAAPRRRPQRDARRDREIDPPEFKRSPACTGARPRGRRSGRLLQRRRAGARLSQQLDAIQQEFVSEQSMLRIDRAANRVSVTLIVSWREADFIAAYDKGATDRGPSGLRSNGPSSPSSRLTSAARE